MPQFFFDVQGDVEKPDRIGLDLDGIQEAWAEAVQYASDLQAETDGVFKRMVWSLTVTDASGLLVFRLDFEPAGDAAG